LATVGKIGKQLGKVGKEIKAISQRERVTSNFDFNPREKKSARAGLSGGPQDDEVKLYETNTKFALNGREQLGMLCIYENTGTKDLRIQVHAIKRGEYLDMHIEASHVQDLIHHAMLMGGVHESEVNQTQGHRRPSIAHGHGHGAPRRASLKGHGHDHGHDDGHDHGHAAADVIAGNHMELLAHLVEVIHEPKQKPDLSLQIVGWVNPTARAEARNVVASSLGSVFHQFKAEQEEERKRFDAG